MTIHIYNTLSNKKEEFIPLERKKVKMYVCGITAYDFSHVGHARVYVVFDVIYRYLKHMGYNVTYVRNFTDIDDKIIKRAAELGVTTTELSEKYIALYHEDMDALGVLRPDFEPKATETIPEMISIIEKLFENGYAYQVGNDVVFSIYKFQDYGKLSGKNIDELQAGARIDIDDKKNNPLDFVLWKGAKPGEPSWESPWGMGRPGWHIECSAMSMKILGQTIDIHGGGRDLTFPHHENEIAQSEGANKKKFVLYWMHNGFVNIDKEKMSKSLGNFMTIRDVRAKYHPESLRFFLLSNHYRSPIDFSEKNLAASEEAVSRLYELKKRISIIIKEGRKGEGVPEEERNIFSQAIAQLKNDVFESMNDDFNTARAIGKLFEFLHNANRFLDFDETLSQSDCALVSEAFDALSMIKKIFGILESDSDAFFEHIKGLKLQNKGLDESEIVRLIESRNQARKNKDFKTADFIRDELSSRGILLKDSPEGTTWKLK